MAATLRIAGVATLVALGLPAAAQTADAFRATVAATKLGAGYAQMINLSAMPDLSAASYRIDAMDPEAKLDVLHLPWRTSLARPSADTEVRLKVAGGWMRLAQAFDVGSSGRIGSRWSAYSVDTGLGALHRISDNLHVEPSIDVGVAQLRNRAGYQGTASALAPIFDGPLFNWTSDAWLLTPGIAAEWRTPIAEGRLHLRGHVAKSWVRTFHESDPAQRFRESAGTYSLRAELLQPTSVRLLDRETRWFVLAGYSGFHGGNRDALGFTGVGEVGGGFDVSIVDQGLMARRARFSASILSGSHVRGWNVGLSLGF